MEHIVLEGLLLVVSDEGDLPGFLVDLLDQVPVVNRNTLLLSDGDEGLGELGTAEDGRLASLHLGT